MAKPTVAQSRVLASMRDGCVLVRSFDVWRGYWWWLRPTNEKVLASTADILCRNRWISAGPDERIYSGYREQVHTLPPSPKD